MPKMMRLAGLHYCLQAEHFAYEVCLILKQEVDAKHMYNICLFTQSPT